MIMQNERNLNRQLTRPLRSGGMQSNFSFLGGIGAGVALMFLLDPVRGRRRRAVLKDQLIHQLNRAGKGVDVASRDLVHRAKGLVHEIRYEATSFLKPERVSDEVLISRVKSKIGRFATRPSAVEVLAHHGNVILRGEAFEDEIYDLLLVVSSIHGVENVQNELKLKPKWDFLETSRTSSEEPLHVSSQKAVSARMSQRRLTPANRLLLGVLGTGVALYSWRTQRGVSTLLRTLGAGIILRGLTNRNFGSWFGVGLQTPLVIRKTIHVQAPVQEVFSTWLDVHNAPQFVPNLKKVDVLDENHSKWLFQRMGAWEQSLDYHVLEKDENKLIVWRAEKNSRVRFEGRTRFTSEGINQTRLDIDLFYYPVFGYLGLSLGRAFEMSPKDFLEHTLVCFKGLIENKVPLTRRVSA